MICRAIAPLLGQGDAFDQTNGFVIAGLGFSCTGHSHHSALQFDRQCFGFGGAVAVSRISTGHDSRLHLRGGRVFEQTQTQHHALRVAAFDSAHGGSDRCANIFSATLTHTDQQHSGGNDTGRPISLQQLAGLALKVAALRGGLDKDRQSVVTLRKILRYENHQCITFFGTNTRTCQSLEFEVHN